jgi:hypothetical protein
MTISSCQTVRREDEASSLLPQTCLEQFARLHTLRLLSDYLAARAGTRKRQVIAKERKALHDLYETVWNEVASTLSTEVAERARHKIEGIPD